MLILRRVCTMIAAVMTMAGAALADPPFSRPLIWDVGVRYWISTGNSAKDLYLPPDVAGGPLISRLDYRRRHAATPEAFARLDHRSGLFAKAKAGIGSTDAGELVNEDFPPIVLGYSRTSHPLNGGELAYWSADLGYTLLSGRAAWSPGTTNGYRLGVFAGYHRNREQMSAYGCRQTVPGQADQICVPEIGTDRIVLSQSNVWDGLRLGLAGDLMLAPRVKLAAEASWLRLALEGYDTHHERAPPRCSSGSCFDGPQRETGTGDGVEVELALTYQLTDRLSLGAGARYWRYRPTEGTAQLRFQDGGSRIAPLSWESERVGVFLQGSLKLD